PLGRLAVLRVLGAPPLEDLVRVADAHGELHVVDRVAGLDLVQEPARHVERRRRLVELQADDVPEVEVLARALATVLHLAPPPPAGCPDRFLAPRILAHRDAPQQGPGPGAPRQGPIYNDADAQWIDGAGP